MKLKTGVRVHGIRPEIVMALLSACVVYEKHGSNLVITSVGEGKHSRGSLHYVGQAVDLRLPASSHTNQVLLELKNALGGDFDVVLESAHIHIEFQPKESYDNGGA